MEKNVSRSNGLKPEQKDIKRLPKDQMCKTFGTTPFHDSAQFFIFFPHHSSELKIDKQLLLQRLEYDKHKYHVEITYGLNQTV